MPIDTGLGLQRSVSLGFASLRRLLAFTGCVPSQAGSLHRLGAFTGCGPRKTTLDHRCRCAWHAASTMPNFMLTPRVKAHSASVLGTQCTRRTALDPTFFFAGPRCHTLRWRHPASQRRGTLMLAWSASGGGNGNGKLEGGSGGCRRGNAPGRSVSCASVGAPAAQT